MTTPDPSPYEYDVAISFAGTERPLALRLANTVRDAGFKVFYDDYYPERLWGKDLAAFFDNVYRKESRYCVIFISTEYARRMWTNHERRSAQARALRERGKEYILPIQVDNIELEGMPPTVGRLELGRYSIEEIGDFLLKKLRAGTDVRRPATQTLPPVKLESEETVPFHPPGTEADRGPLRPCSFFIKPGYEVDPRHRWERLADIEVELVGVGVPPTVNVYLIPSGRVKALVRHSLRLKIDPRALALKRKASQEFVEKRMGRRLKGFWFLMRKDEIEFPTVYSAEYDQFLNHSLPAMVA